MAESTITSFYNPVLFDQNLILGMLNKNLLINSGVAVVDPRVMKVIDGASGSQTIDLPYVDAIAADEPNVSSDVTGSTSTPKARSGSKCRAIGSFLNQSWSDMDLVKYFTGVDPLLATINGIAEYWLTSYNKRLIATIQGILLDNTTNDGGDMVYNIANAAATTDPTDANLISASAVINTRLTSGDRLSEYNMIIMHSIVYARLEENNLIDFIPDSDGKVNIPTYHGMRVMYDDDMPYAATGTNADSSTKYTYDTYLLGAGTIAFGDANPENASELYRAPDKGNGGGQTYLYSRRMVAIHPYGFDWLQGSMASDSPTLAELRLAANWNRKYDRKRISIACLRTNG